MDANLQKYLAFVRTADLGSFSLAAVALDYSQSGISRMISDLEHAWGVTLFVRSRAGVQLPSDGLRLLPEARALCRQYERMEEAVQRVHGLVSGLIRIGTFSSVATYVLPQVIRTFQRDYGGVDYDLLLGDYTEIETWLAEGQIDLGFLRLPAGRRLSTRPLMRDEWMAVLPWEHPLASLEEVPLEALCNDPFLLLEKEGNDDISALFRDLPRQPAVKFRAWDDYAIMAMVEQGLGVSLLPELVLQKNPFHLELRSLREHPARHIALALREERPLSAATKMFLRYL